MNQILQARAAFQSSKHNCQPKCQSLQSLSPPTPRNRTSHYLLCQFATNANASVPHPQPLLIPTTRNLSTAEARAAASTNPLSLTPAEVVQYRLAGLELDEEVPKVKGWPHRGFPYERLDIGRRNAGVDLKGKGKEVIRSGDNDEEDGENGEGSDERQIEIEVEETKRQEAPPRLRMQHLAVLTAILQRCLLQGDIPRASRAWAILVRMQVGGKSIDIRGSGYWAVGAELLIRSGEKTPARRPPRKSEADSSDEEEDDDDDQQSELEPQQNGQRRYGTAAGLEKAKEYYEQLILEHPFNRQYHDKVSALDIWPAMVGCELYGIQQEQKESLQKVAFEEEDQYQDEDAADSHSDSEPEVAAGEEDDFYSIEERRKARRRQMKAEKRWHKRDEIRRTALTAYERLAARLDDLLTTMPYSDRPEILRLRGMLALCIGDLMVPALPPMDEEDEGVEDRLERNRGLGIDQEDTQRRLLLRQRVSEHEQGKRGQKEEHIRARKVFERIERAGGRKEGLTDSLPREGDGTEKS